MRKVKWNWKTVFVVLLAVVLPVSLVITFQLLGERTRIAENVTLDPLVWTLERPKGFISIGDLLNASYAEDGFSATSHMMLDAYLPKTDTLQFDEIRIMIKMNLTTDKDDHISKVRVVFNQDSQPSTLDWQELDFGLELDELHYDYTNISLVGKSEEGTKASISLDTINNPTRATLSATARWRLYTPDNQDHQREIVYEVTYYNGTAYNRVVQPFQLNILGAEE